MVYALLAADFTHTCRKDTVEEKGQLEASERVLAEGTILTHDSTSGRRRLMLSPDLANVDARKALYYTALAALGQRLSKNIIPPENPVVLPNE